MMFFLLVFPCVRLYIIRRLLAFHFYVMGWLIHASGRDLGDFTWLRWGATTAHGAVHILCVLVTRFYQYLNESMHPWVRTSTTTSCAFDLRGPMLTGLAGRFDPKPVLVVHVT